jgi:hypothetical protein
MTRALEGNMQDESMPIIRNLSSSPIDVGQTAARVHDYLQDRGLSDAAIGGTTVEFQRWRPFPLTLFRGDYSYIQHKPNEGVVRLNTSPRSTDRRLIHELEHRIDHAQGTIDEGGGANGGVKMSIIGMAGFTAVTVIDTLASYAKYRFHRQNPYVRIPENLQRKTELIATGSKIGYLLFGASLVGGYLSYRLQPTERRAHKAARKVHQRLVVKR